ncbi:MAG: competence protein CoiA family protein [Rhodospirillales bacterium]|nr:competence protein CoiA family protein [Rhodospirillales bacterium]
MAGNSISKFGHTHLIEPQFFANWYMPMLVALLDEHRVEADSAKKGAKYQCPHCHEVVILKQGRIRTHHFAHKPPVGCAWGKGETHEHREAKKLFRDEFVRRGLRAEVECEIHSLSDDRRADVVVWSPKGNRFALELQHTGIDYANLERRTLSYIRAGVPVLWIPFLQPKFWEAAKQLAPNEDGDYRIERFTARPLDQWVHDFYYKKPWMYDPRSGAVWRYRLGKHLLYKNYSSWHDGDGNEQSAGESWYPSTRWQELTLWGPYSLDQILIDVLDRKADVVSNRRYPGGKVAKLVLRRVASR